VQLILLFICPLMPAGQEKNAIYIFTLFICLQARKKMQGRADGRGVWVQMTVV